MLLPFGFMLVVSYNKIIDNVHHQGHNIAAGVFGLDSLIIVVINDNSIPKRIDVTIKICRLALEKDACLSSVKHNAV